MKELRDKKEKLDTNGDGKIDDAERAAKRAEMAEKLKAKHPELFAKLDTNGDGALSAMELQSLSVATGLVRS
jgi:Ca2+-binding EF-hand superfamily protein